MITDRKNFTNDQVRDILGSERQYQDNNYPNRHSAGGYLLLLCRYLSKAETAWCDPPHDHRSAALDGVRKLGAIALRCFEEHADKSREDAYEELVSWSEDYIYINSALSVASWINILRTDVRILGEAWDTSLEQQESHDEDLASRAEEVMQGFMQVLAGAFCCIQQHGAPLR